MIWILIAALTALVVLCLAYPALKARPQSLSRAQYDLQVYKDQLAEVEREVARGVLSDTQAEAARLEIQRRILALGTVKEGGKGQVRAHGLAILSLVVVPLVGLGVYAMLGHPHLKDQPIAARQAEMSNQAEMVQNMVKSLAARLEKNPQDGPGWSMLGRSLGALGLMEPALEAYEKARQLMPGNTDLRMEYAGLILRGHQPGAPMPKLFVDLMREILAVDPNSVDALYFLGGAAAEEGDFNRARELWTRLLKNMEPDSEDYRLVEKQLNELPK